MPAMILGKLAKILSVWALFAGVTAVDGVNGALGNSSEPVPQALKIKLLAKKTELIRGQMDERILSTLQGLIFRLLIQVLSLFGIANLQEKY
jgi:hypothetical protein